MTHRIAYLRATAEVFIAVVIGHVIVWKSWWCDPDKVIVPYWYVVILAAGVAFGFFGRCRIWVIAFISSWVPIYAALVPMRWAFTFELAMFVWFFIIVLIGGAIGRGAKRYWIRKRANDAA